MTSGFRQIPNSINLTGGNLTSRLARSIGNGSGFLTYSAATGVRLLDFNTEVLTPTSPFAPGGATNTNFRVTPAFTQAFTTTAFNTLAIHDGGNALIAGGATVTINGGGILSTGTSLNRISSGGGTSSQIVRIRGPMSPVGLVINTVADLTSTVLLDNGAGLPSQFVKIGPGTLTLDPRTADGVTIAGGSVGFSDVRIYEGTLAITAPEQSLGALPGTGPLFFANGGRLRYTSPIGGNLLRVLNFVGSGGAIDLTGTTITLGQGIPQLVGTGSLTLEGGVLNLFGNQSNLTFSGGIILAGGQLAISINSPTLLGTGPITFRGGGLVPRTASRTVDAPAVFEANATFVNNLNLPGSTDNTNASLTFALPARLNASVTLTNSMNSINATTGNVTFASTIYENPFNPPAALTLAASGTSPGRFILSAPNGSLYTGGTTIGNQARVLVNNVTGSGLGSGAVSVNTGGTLSGSGQVATTAGNITFADGARVAPSPAGANLRLTAGGAGTIMLGSAPGPGTAAVWSIVLTGTPGTGGVPANSGQSSTGTMPNPGNHGFLTLSAAPNSVTLPAGLRFEVDASAVAGSFGPGLYSYQIGQVTGLSGGGQTYTDPASFTLTGFSPPSISVTVAPGGAVYLNINPVPEPGLVLALAAGCGLALGGVRRCRRLLSTSPQPC